MAKVLPLMLHLHSATAAAPRAAVFTSQNANACIRLDTLQQLRSKKAECKHSLVFVLSHNMLVGSFTSV